MNSPVREICTLGCVRDVEGNLHIYSIIAEQRHPKSDATTKGLPYGEVCLESGVSSDYGCVKEMDDAGTELETSAE